MHYNNGGRSKKLLRAKDYICLSNEIPNLAAVKFMNDSLEDVINAAYDKLYIKSTIPEFPMRLYPPYQTFSDQQVNDYFSQMRARLPHWFE